MGSKVRQSAQEIASLTIAGPDVRASTIFGDLVEELGGKAVEKRVEENVKARV